MTEIKHDEKMLEFSGLFGDFIAGVIDANRDTIKQSSHNFLAEKKRTYKGYSYIEQLEKNYIYFDCCSQEMTRHISLFFLGQEIIPNESELDFALNQIRLSVRSESSALLKFLINGCNGCDYHDEHQRVNNIRQMRLTNKEAYYDEVEFGCLFNRARLTIAQTCLVLLWNKDNSDLANTTNLEMKIAHSVVHTYVWSDTAAVLNDQPVQENGSRISYVVVDK